MSKAKFGRGVYAATAFALRDGHERRAEIPLSCKINATVTNCALLRGFSVLSCVAREVILHRRCDDVQAMVYEVVLGRGVEGYAARFFLLCSITPSTPSSFLSPLKSPNRTSIECALACLPTSDRNTLARLHISLLNVRKAKSQSLERLIMLLCSPTLLLRGKILAHDCSERSITPGTPGRR